MGTNSAPEIANLTCYVDERDEMNQLISAGKIDEAKKHADNFRHIDDILGWNIKPPSPERYGLKWEETTRPDGSVVYLGAVIKKMDGRIDISVFDKAAEWPFLVLRYPHSASNVPYHQPAGVFQGQLVRYRIICNSIKNFKHATQQMVIKLLKRDHSPVTIMKGWNKHLSTFCNDRITNYSNLRNWFRRMLRWATYQCKCQTNLQQKQWQKWVPKNMDKQQSLQQSDKNKNTQKEPKNMEKQQFQQQTKNSNKLKEQKNGKTKGSTTS